jgi:hypothetical protein
MDVFAGRLPTSSRVGPPRERRDPPSWEPGVDPAACADVVFVQFSEPCIRDATGVWLKDYVVQGIQYILSFAKPYVTKNVVINLSYGPTTGPHDGTAELEMALTALVNQFDGTHGKPKLEIALPAGNAYFGEGHVVFARRTAKDPDHVEWTWRLPPDNAVLCFAEIWMETAAAGIATIRTRLRPPELPFRPPASMCRSCGATTRCGGSTSGPPLLQASSPSMVTGGSGSAELAPARTSMPMWRGPTPTWAYVREPDAHISSILIGSCTIWPPAVANMLTVNSTRPGR